MKRSKFLGHFPEKPIFCCPGSTTPRFQTRLTPLIDAPKSMCPFLVLVSVGSWPSCRLYIKGFAVFNFGALVDLVVFTFRGFFVRFGFFVCGCFVVCRGFFVFFEQLVLTTLRTIVWKLVRTA